MNDAPVIETERFELWRPRHGDLTDLCRLVEDEETRRYLGPSRLGETAQFERLMRNAGSWMLYGYGTFIVRPRGQEDIVATCGVFHSWRGYGPDARLDDVPEAGWIVRQDWWKQGVATEIMTAALAWFDREHGPRRIACIIEQGNTASERVAAKLGFATYGFHTLNDANPPVTLRLLDRSKA